MPDYRIHMQVMLRIQRQRLHRLYSCTDPNRRCRNTAQAAHPNQHTTHSAGLPAAYAHGHGNRKQPPPAPRCRRHARGSRVHHHNTKGSMSVLAFWLAFVAAVTLFVNSPLFGWLERIMDAPDGKPYYPPTRSARAATKAKHAPNTKQTPVQEVE